MGVHNSIQIFRRHARGDGYPVLPTACITIDTTTKTIQLLQRREAEYGCENCQGNYNQYEVLLTDHSAPGI